MIALKHIFRFSFSAMFFVVVVCADSIIFLPDSNSNQKQNIQDDFSGTDIDSNLRLFDIQNKGFHAEDSGGFRILPNEDSKIRTTIDLPKDMQQEELLQDYSNAFETSAIDAINTEFNELKLVQNTHSVRIQQSKRRVIEVANGATFIAVSNEQNPQTIRIKDKIFPWVLHPKDSKKKIAFIPIHYKAKLETLEINDNFSIQIVQGKYKKEKITITDTTKTKLSKTANERIAKELAEANAIYSAYTKDRYWNGRFILPLDSVITSPFGSARVFNNEIKSFHSGTDFRAAIGTPIRASNDGIVVIAKERFLAGKSVVIDHGEGIFSMYYHCSDIKVKLGERVKKGQIIALSGDTGRVSGPHLHFGILINGVQVDAIDFINKVNAL